MRSCAATESNQEEEKLWSAAQRSVFSRPLREKVFISRYCHQNASDLVEQAKRSGSAGTRCWAVSLFGLIGVIPHILSLVMTIRDNFISFYGTTLKER